jgi:predicted secreted protein
MVSKKTALAAGMLICAFCLWAGDSASFVDLGFSPDGKVYMFAQYGVESTALKPWADLFVVDVARNAFVPGGSISYPHDSPIQAGQDGSGALYRLLTKNADIANRHGISFPNQGQPLYIALDPAPSSSGEIITFRDFEANRFYTASLVSSVEGSGQSLKSSFYINLECSGGGVSKTWTVGSPQIKRPLVVSYNIKKVIVNPKGDSIIFVIEMKKQSPGGVNTRYMVEALRL